MEEETVVKQTIGEKRVRVSLGEKRVRVSFNVADGRQHDDIATIKHLSAQLIDICEYLKDKDPRLAYLAQTAYEEAAMWAVKAATA